MDRSQLEPLVSGLAATWEALKMELAAFADYLDSLDADA